MVESLPFTLLLGTLLAFLSGIGIGGGSLLVLWLTMVLNMSAADVRSINLLFFIPSALIACFFRRKQGVLDIKTVLPAMIAGCIGAAVFSWLGSFIDTLILKKLFGGLLIATGLRELFYRHKKKEAS